MGTKTEILWSQKSLWKPGFDHGVLGIFLFPLAFTGLYAFFTIKEKTDNQ